MSIWLSKSENHTNQWLKGWAFSLTFHAFVLAAVISAMPKFILAPQKEPFKWEVALVDAPQQTPVAEPSPAQTEVPQPTPTKLQPAPPTPVETYQPIVRQMETRPVVETVQHEIRQVAEVVHPPQETVQVEMSRSIVVEKPDAVIVEKPTEAPAVAKTESTVIEQPTETTTAAVASSPSHEVRHQPLVTQPVQPIVTASAPPHPERASRQTQNAPQAAAPSPESAAHESPPMQEEKPGPAMRASEPQVALATKPIAPTKADYGWLAESLHRRIVELRQYPSTARLNGWQGKVVLRVIIKDDGHLEDVTVLTSSGFEALDQAAVEAVRRACPLKMRHQLGRPTVVVQVPVNYTLAN